MQHIKQAMANTLENSSKAKFFYGNTDKFLQYFDSLQQYEALIRAGRFVKMEEIIKEKTTFRVKDFLEKLK